jgi:hypothetical protein
MSDSSLFGNQSVPAEICEKHGTPGAYLLKPFASRSVIQRIFSARYSYLVSYVFVVNGRVNLVHVGISTTCHVSLTSIQKCPAFWLRGNSTRGLLNGRIGFCGRSWGSWSGSCLRGKSTGTGQQQQQLQALASKGQIEESGNFATICNFHCLKRNVEQSVWSRSFFPCPSVSDGYNVYITSRDLRLKMKRYLTWTLVLLERNKLPI